MQVATRSQDGELNEEVEGATGQATVSNESQDYVSFHGFLKWGTSALFDTQIVNLYVGSYLR